MENKWVNNPFKYSVFRPSCCWWGLAPSQGDKIFTSLILVDFIERDDMYQDGLFLMFWTKLGSMKNLSNVLCAKRGGGESSSFCG